MGKDHKDHSSKKPFHSGKAKPSFTQHSYQGGNSTLQQMSANNGTDKLFNGGSPVLFKATKPSIQRVFVQEGVWNMIQFAADATRETIEEDTFTMHEPQELDMVDHVINAHIAARALRLTADEELIAAEVDMTPETRRSILLQLRLSNSQLVEKIYLERPRLMDSFHRAHADWVKEKEKYEVKEQSLMKAFTKCFGLTILSTVREFLDTSRYRRAWFEINAANDVANMGQMNTAVLLDEWNGMTFNAAKSSFTTLEANIKLLQDQLLEHGHPPLTDEAMLYKLTKLLETSPNKEFQKQADFVKMSNLSYAEARLVYIQRAGELANLKSLNRTHAGPIVNARLNVATANTKCKTCGKKHPGKKCPHVGRPCHQCGEEGHWARDCQHGQDKDTDADKNGNVVDASSKSFGSKFNAKKPSVYSNSLVLTEQELNERTAGPLTDHHVSANAGHVILLILQCVVSETVNVLSLIRIILDSGASTHMLPMGFICSDYRSSVGQVRLGDSRNTLPIVGIGDTILEFITDVLHVDRLLIGILSVSRFDKIQFRTEFINGKGNVYDAQGHLVLSSTLDEDGLYSVDPEFVECMMSGISPNMHARVHVSSVTAIDASQVLHNISPVKLSDRVSSPRSLLGEDTNTKERRVMLGPGTSFPNEVASVREARRGNVTGPVSDDTSHQCHTLTEALEGETPPTGILSTDGNGNDYEVSKPVLPTNNVLALNPLEILHRQLGHIGAAKIKSMLKDRAVKGCKYTYNDVKDLEIRVCNECYQGRMRAKPEGKTTDHPWGVLEKIAADYKGPFARGTYGGAKGFFLLVDYKTNWLYAGLVKSKNEHTRVLQDFKVNYTMRYGQQWKVLQSDSESIFKSTRVANWLRKNEIRLTLSTPYQHWQNGQVEVYVRIVMDRTRTVMMVYNTPLKYWGYAIEYVCYTLNHTPNTNTNISAFEALTGEKPDITNAIPFYAPGVYHLTKDERKDPWSPKARPCRMLGYAPNYKNAYYILNVESGRVIVRENCIFDVTSMEQDVIEIEVDQGEDRDDIDEFDIMIDDTDNDESDNDSDVSEVEFDEVLGVPNIEFEPIEVVEDIDYGGDHPYWNPNEQYLNYLNTITPWKQDEFLNNYYSSYCDWRTNTLCAIGFVPPLPKNPNTPEEAMNGPHAVLWEKAITKELEQFRIRNTFGEAEQFGKGMKTKLILYYKYDGDYNLVCKARLVVCGYSQIPGVDYNETYSPTTTSTTVFSLLCLAGVLGAHLFTFDVSAAFLEGRADTKMFAWLPGSIDSNGISQRIEILGNWYGSKQAGKIWNDLYDEIMIRMDFERSMDNPCLYKWSDAVDYIYQTVHVDDGAGICSSREIADEFMQEFLQHVRKAVLFHEVKLYLGMDIERSEDGTMFRVSQARYIQEKFGDHKRIFRTPMAKTTNLRVAEPNINNDSLLPITGKLRYLADRTRPDILVATGEVSTGGAESPSDEHCEVAERVQHYLIHTIERALLLGGRGPIVLFGYCDAAYISVGKSKSRLGSCLFLNYDSGAISCVSKNDTTISHSSTEAEIKAIDMLCREIESVRSILKFLGQEQLEPTKIYVDNKSAMELCKTLKVRNSVKHINVRINYIRELINARVIELVFVPSKYNVADVLTKPLAEDDHNRHSQVLMEGHTNNEDGILMTIESYEYYINMIEAEEFLNNNTTEITPMIICDKN